MGLQAVADKIDAAEKLAGSLPETDDRDRLIIVLGEAYKMLVSASADLVAQLDEIQDMTRNLRNAGDAA